MLLTPAGPFLPESEVQQRTPRRPPRWVPCIRGESGQVWYYGPALWSWLQPENACRACLRPGGDFCGLACRHAWKIWTEYGRCLHAALVCVEGFPVALDLPAEAMTFLARAQRLGFTPSQALRFLLVRGLRRELLERSELW